MTDHPTLEPAAAVRVRAGEPSGAALATAFVDVVCADHELLHAEFDAIIAANFPDAAGRGQRRRPGTAVTTATRRVSSRRMPTGPVRHAVRGGAGAAQNLRARQRGPPRPDSCRPTTPGLTRTTTSRAVTNRRWWYRPTRHHPRARMRPAGRDHPHSRASVLHPGAPDAYRSGRAG